jgi:hypothetical protein
VSALLAALRFRLLEPALGGRRPLLDRVRHVEDAALLVAHHTTLSVEPGGTELDLRETLGLEREPRGVDPGTGQYNGGLDVTYSTFNGNYTCQFTDAVAARYTSCDPPGGSFMLPQNSRATWENWHYYFPVP